MPAGVMRTMNSLAALRKKRALTQGELGRLSGVNGNLISRYERGAAQPALETLKKLAGALGVTTDEILSDPPKPLSADDLAVNIIWEEADESMWDKILPNTFAIGFRGDDLLIAGAVSRGLSADDIAERVKLEVEAAEAAAKARDKVLKKKGKEK